MQKRASLILLLGLISVSATTAADRLELSPDAAGRLASLALDCVHLEYPNKISHVMQSDRDLKPPRELTPTFYGCFDWHSAVHGHWMLVRLARTFPSQSFAEKALEAVSKNITDDHIAVEVSYIEGEGRASFERPYGLAWLMQLGSELREWDSPEASALSKTLEPLERAAVGRLKDWLPKLNYAIRVGEHSQTAFAFGLVLDWARTAATKS